MNKDIIELKNVNLTYNRGKSNAFQALFNITLAIKKGEFVVVLGPSGCGKSTLLNIIAGLEEPDSGTVLVDQHDYAKMKKKEKVRLHREKIGMIFQAYNLIPTLNVLNNVTLPQMFINIRKKDRQKRALALLEKVGIKEHWKKLPTELSGGQQQRISIARAIINDPPLILADEPTGNLDTKSANNVMQILGELNRKEGKTIILVTHNPDNTRWGNHIIYMKDGRIEREEKKISQDEFTKTEVLKESKAFETDRILDKFKGLSRDQIKLLITPFKTQALVDFLLFPYEEKQVRMIQEGIESFLVKRNDFLGLLEYLDKPLEEGGVGLDRRTAEKFLGILEQLLETSHLVSRSQNVDEKAMIITEFLLKKRRFKIAEEAVPVLRALIKQRLLKVIDRPSFERQLSASFEKGGAGMDKRSARKIIRKIDLILLVGYGESGNNKKLKKNQETFSREKTPFNV